jgi:hypothetical protein
VASIKAGRLRAYTFSATTAKRPRYKIDPADVEVFIAGCAVQPPAAKAPRTRRQKPDPNFVEYF